MTTFWVRNLPTLPSQAEHEIMIVTETLRLFFFHFLGPHRVQYFLLTWGVMTTFWVRNLPTLPSLVEHEIMVVLRLCYTHWNFLVCGRFVMKRVPYPLTTWVTDMWMFSCQFCISHPLYRNDTLRITNLFGTHPFSSPTRPASAAGSCGGPCYKWVSPCATIYTVMPFNVAEEASLTWLIFPAV